VNTSAFGKEDFLRYQIIYHPDPRFVVFTATKTITQKDILFQVILLSRFTIAVISLSIQGFLKPLTTIGTKGRAAQDLYTTPLKKESGVSVGANRLWSPLHRKGQRKELRRSKNVNMVFVDYRNSEPPSPLCPASVIEFISPNPYHTNMIAIIDYGMGNLRSVEKGFMKAGVDVTVTNSPEIVKKADGVVLPGVGAFKDCMRELTNLALVDAVVEAVNQGKPYLGICLGLQVLFSESVEFGQCRGLDVIRGKVMKFESRVMSQESGVASPDSPRLTPNSNLLTLKVPHMGWNEIKIQKSNPLFDGIPDKSYFYFVHSFYVAPDDASIIATTTDYGIEFTSSVRKDNIFAVQFHPEKSQELGLRMLKNFGEIVRKGF